MLTNAPMSSSLCGCLVHKKLSVVHDWAVQRHVEGGIRKGGTLEWYWECSTRAVHTQCKDPPCAMEFISWNVIFFAKCGRRFSGSAGQVESSLGGCFGGVIPGASTLGSLSTRGMQGVHGANTPSMTWLTHCQQCGKVTHHVSKPQSNHSSYLAVVYILVDCSHH